MARPALDRAGVISKVVRTMPLRQLAREDIARAAVVSPRPPPRSSQEVLTVAGGMEGRALWETSDVDEDAVRRRLDA
jgi:3-oxoacyl-[acyl-carrier protein] reductase